MNTTLPMPRLFVWNICKLKVCWGDSVGGVLVDWCPTTGHSALYVFKQSPITSAHQKRGKEREDHLLSSNTNVNVNPCIHFNLNQRCQVRQRGNFQNVMKELWTRCHVSASMNFSTGGKQALCRGQRKWGHLAATGQRNWLPDKIDMLGLHPPPAACSLRQASTAAAAGEKCRIVKWKGSAIGVLLPS